MYERVEKPKENKSRSVANTVGQKKSNGNHSLGFVDNRAIPKGFNATKNFINEKVARDDQNPSLSINADLVQLYTIEKATGKQGGDYVRGNAQIHLHINIGKNTHLKVEGKSIKIVDGSGNIVVRKCQEAYNYLESFEDSIKNDLQRAKNYSSPIQDCKDWLVENGAKKTIVEDKSEEKEPEEKKEDEQKGYGDFFDRSKMKSNQDEQSDEDDFM